MSANHRLLKFCRTIHLYLGVFTAPALLFFAITGGLQTFSLHETTRGSSYTPPAWLATVALLHKKQTIVAPPKRPRPVEIVAPIAADAGTAAPSSAAAGAGRAITATGVASAIKAAPAAADGDTPKKNLLPMKLFFALVASALALSTLTGIYMAYRYSRKPALVSGVLLAGIVLPLLLLIF